MKRLLQNVFGSRKHKPASRKRPQLRMETLEDRRMMTTASLTMVPIGLPGMPPAYIGQLSVEGTSGNDQITVSHSGSQITVSGVPNSFNASSVQVLRVNGQSGNDNISINLFPTDHIDVLVHGGLGNDVIRGSALADKLFGDEGSDYLYGGQGNDRL